MKNKSIFKILSIFWVSSMIFTACMSDVELSNISKDILIDESLVVPVGEAGFNVKEMLQKLSIDNQVTTEGTEIYFEQEETSSYDFRKFVIPNATLVPNPSFTFPAGNYPTNTTLTTNIITSLNLGLNSNVANERVDSIKVKSATLNININKGTLKLSSVKVILKFQGNTARFSNGKDTISFTDTKFTGAIDYPISNFVIKPLGTTGLPLQIVVEAKTNVAQTVSSAQSVSTAISFKNFNFDVAYGAFQPATIATQTQQIPLDVSSYLPNAFLKFANPQATITAKTNVGTYVRFRIDYIKAFLKSNPSASEAKANFNGNDYFDYNMSKPANPGDFATKVETFNSVNARTDLLFANPIRPDVLEYKFSTYLNQDSLSAHPTVPLFFPSDGKVETTVKVKIPLYLTAGSKIDLNDTLQIADGTIGSKLDNSVIDSAVLVFKVKNGLPIKVKLAFSFIDLNGVKISTTLDDLPYTINAPTIDSDGKAVVSSIVAQTIKVNVSKAQFEDLKKAKSVIFNVTAEGNNISSAIHFTTSDTFNVKLGVFVKGNAVRNLSNN
ncbi:MAG TPA: hypothetical protein VFD03_07330 [Clostridia bacterium]|nr:hypothetical protein [Clostridia bacterium]